MPLTDTSIRQARPGVSNYKLSDALGLFLLIQANGGRYWRLKYRYAGKEKLLALGVYPEVSLRDARAAVYCSLEYPGGCGPARAAPGYRTFRIRLPQPPLPSATHV